MPSTSPPILNVLSIDVEEYFHATIFTEAARRWPVQEFASRVEVGIDTILGVLNDHDTRATFFVLGEVAAAHPLLIRRIASLGHEVACHGYSHALVPDLGPERFSRELRRAKAVLEEAAGCPVIGYRAPSFSLRPDHTWALDILLAEGFRYDSSIYPIRHDRYGAPAAPRFPHSLLTTTTAELLEFPIGTTRVWGTNLPIGGGGYLRLLPFAFIRWGIARVNRAEHRPVMFYLHPWEVDPAQPRFPLPWPQRVRHYSGISRVERKLRELLRDHAFTTAAHALGLA